MNSVGLHIESEVNGSRFPNNFTLVQTKYFRFFFQ